MRRLRLLLLLVLGVPAVLVALAVAAWAVDTRDNERVVRNVTLGGADVGGSSESELRAEVGAAARRYRDAEVEVRTGGKTFSTTMSALGARIDEQATVVATMDVGRDGALPGRPLGWLASFVDDRDARVQLAIDDARLASTLAEADPDRSPPVEPSLDVVEGSVTAVGGRDGEGVDPAAVAAELREAVARGELPVVVTVPRTQLQPRFTLDDAERVARHGEELAARQLRVAVGSREATVPDDTVREWMTAVPEPDGLQLRLADEEVGAGLAQLVPDAGTPARNASFSVDTGAVVLHPSAGGTGCCGGEPAARLLEALEADSTEPVRLPLRDVEPELTTEEAQKLGIVEKVGEFTTNHAAGQSRVANIHRIADITRGVVILPGDTFSVNGFVGQRTRDKGFVEAGVIYNGRFASDVGGGISQYATTLFNAAFFGGLDFGEYQSHSIYISRYPYGREATLSFPHPDLQVKNPSPHGVLIWTRYTASSITIELWSTRWATAEQTNQTRQRRGNCTRVSTERTRTFVDGRVEKDLVYAIYRPGEGVAC